MQGTELLRNPDFAKALEQSPFQAQDLPALSTAVADTFQRLTPDQREEFQEALDELRGMTAEQLQSFLRLITYVEQNPSEYPKLVEQMVASGAFDPEDAPQEYDPSLMAVLKVMVEQALSDVQSKAQAPGFADGGIVSLKSAADKVRSAGRDGDTILAHINPLEAGMLKRMGGRGTINPKTGLPEFGFWDSFKKIFKIGAQIIGTVLLTPFVGPIGAGAIVGGVSSLLSGAKPGDALKSALIGGITGGLGGGVSSVLGGGGFLEGALSGGSLFGGGASSLFGGAGAAPAAAAEGGASGVASSLSQAPAYDPTTMGREAAAAAGQIAPTVSAAAPSSSGISGLLSPQGLKDVWSNYKLPIMLGGGAALIGLSNASKETVRPSLVQGPTGTQLLAQQPGLYGFNPANFAQQTGGARPSIFPGGGYISPTTPATAAPTFDFTKITYPTPFTTGTRMAKAGGHISGPGTGTSDSIPARLSDGEFVMTAQAVRGAGNGDRMKGARKMYELMHKFERMA